MSTKAGTTVVEHAPPPSNAYPHERARWLEAFPPDVPWLDELRTRHETLAHAWADAVDDIAQVRELHADAERAFRATTRDAVAVGEPVPPRPPEVDPAKRDAELAIAVEDAHAARDELAAAAMDVLQALRANRAEISFEGLAPDLVRSLTIGGANRQAALIESMRRNLEHLQEPAIEILDDDSGPTPDLDVPSSKEAA